MNAPRFLRWSLVAACLVALIFLGSCGGGAGGDSPVILSGRFIDGPVEGLRYESVDLSGYTAADGGFQYVQGHLVSFYVGEVKLGSALGAPIVTPISLVPGARDETNGTVINIARFIQSLDDDGYLPDGLRIPRIVHDYAVSVSIRFSQPTDVFESDGAVQSLVATLTGLTAAGTHPLYSVASAQRELQRGLLELVAGAYTGDFTPISGARWSIAVASTGTVTGSVADSNGNTLLDVGGRIDTDRNVFMVADSYDEAYLFQGTIFLGSGITGDWAGVAPVSNPLDLAKAAGCLACHSVDKNVVGPAWNDVAARYRNTDARGYLIEKVKTGGKGNWTDVTGGVPMPPYYPRVPQYYIATLVDYILSLGN